MRPDDRKYLKSHEWVKVVEGDICLMGLSDYAVKHLSDLVFLDLPDVGADIMQNEPYGEIESVKAVSDLFSPVTGEVLEHNETLLGDLTILASDPWEAGWMVKVKMQFPDELENLLDAAGYEEVIKAEEG